MSPSPEDVVKALALAHHLVAQGQPLQALRVVAEVLRAAGLERQASESVNRVQQALAAGSASAHAADELAGLLSLVSLQAPQESPLNSSGPLAQSPGFSQQHQWQQQPSGNSSGPTGMDMEGGTGPGPPLTHHGSNAEQLGRLVAAAEGDSYVCRLCGGVVSVARQQAHEQLWCPALHGS